MTTQATVTQGDWSVGYETGSNTKGTEVILSVFRFPKALGGRIVRGEGYGRRFPTQEAAQAFAVERGFLQPYRRGWCPVCRVQHLSFDGKRRGPCHKAL